MAAVSIRQEIDCILLYPPHPLSSDLQPTTEKQTAAQIILQAHYSRGVKSVTVCECILMNYTSLRDAFGTGLERRQSHHKGHPPTSVYPQCIVSKCLRVLQIGILPSSVPGVMCLLAPERSSDSNPKNSVTHIYAFLINAQSCSSWC